MAMTVGDLIEELSHFDLDKEVFLKDGDMYGGSYNWIDGIYETTDEEIIIEY